MNSGLSVFYSFFDDKFDYSLFVKYGEYYRTFIKYFYSNENLRPKEHPNIVIYILCFNGRLKKF